MKKVLLKKSVSILAIFILFISQIVFAQVPPESLNGEELKTWLRTNYYDGKHETLGYSTARMYLYNYIDNENGVITCVYSGLEVNSAYGGTTTYPAPINCEHTIPQSYFGEADPMVSDIHHLYPTYENWNSTRSNYPLTDINDNETAKWMYLDQSQTTIPSSNIDLYSEYANSTFEPREDHKGNAARSIFYFYTMYPTQAGDISQIGDIDIFYQWHLADPVDAEEIERNGEVETYQGNRNPFIDYPELVARAWGFTVVETVPSAPAIQMNAGETSISLSWTNVSSENGYKLYKSVDGSSYNLVSDIAANTTSYTDNSVSEDITYYYYVLAYNDYGNSGNSNIVSGELNTGGGGGTGTATELLFSEYIEGSSYNKGLEVANFTGSAVDLSNYSIRKQTNGAGDWGTILTLSGTLAHGDVFVVVNSSASAEMKAVADLETGVDALTFNGNDPLGLFKNGTLIDMIGTFNSALVFAQDVTLVRNSDILSPNTTYSISEWTTYPVDTYTYLGSHSVDGGTIDTEAPSAPTSLASANITETTFTLSWTASTDNVAVTAYNIYQDGSLLTSISNTTYNVTGLTAATAYNYYVTAEDAAGNISVASNTLSVTTGSVADTEAPTTPTSLASANITESSFTLSWLASTDNVAVTAYNIYQDGNLLTSTSNTTYNVAGLTAATTYSYYITAEDAAGNTSALSSSIIVTTSEIQITYCDSYGKSTTDEWLNQVIIADINYTSGNNGGYADFTSLSANVETGTTYNITLYPGFSGRNYKEVYSIWIDFNQDGTFDESTELAFKYTSKYSPVTGSFTVPDDALPGSTRMRISMKYNAAASPCEIFSYGEVEDYTVNITDSKASTLASSVSPELTSLTNLTVKLYPNPAKNVTNLELNSETNTSFEYKLIDISGRVISTKKDIIVNGYKEEHIDISNLKSGIYFIMISNQEYKETFKLIVK